MPQLQGPGKPVGRLGGRPGGRECRSADEVVDLVRGGQGVFGIAVGSVWREVEGTLATLPGEEPSGAPVEAPTAGDELAARRARRQAV